MTPLDSTAPKTLNEKIISKLHADLKYEINCAAEIASNCGFWDLLRLLYEMRLNRMVMIIPHYRENASHADIISFHLNDEALRYSISLVAKYGDWKNLAVAETRFHGFDINRVHKLQQKVRSINAKFETEILFHSAEILSIQDVAGKCKISLSSEPQTTLQLMHFQYGVRIEEFAHNSKDSSVPITDLINKLQKKHSYIKDQFEIEWGISLAEYCDGMLDLNKFLEKQGMQAEKKLDENEHGNIDPFCPESFFHLAKSFVLSDAQLESEFSLDFAKHLHSNAFNASDFNDSELRFHYLSRKPFLKGDGFFIVSPELIFDSLLDNIHYTFLESAEFKNIYKEINSIRFIDQIVLVAEKEGYREIDRDVYLNEGKKNLGDIDLILHNERSNHTLFIEGKNHALPLDVYFRSPKSIEARIENTLDWKNKVQQRINHLNGGASSYTLPEKWDYIIVSKMPEPLSHFSDLIVLSIGEFEQWLARSPRPSNFSDFYMNTYTKQNRICSPSELEMLADAGFLPFRW